MKLTRAARKLIISQIKEGNYLSVGGGINKLWSSIETFPYYTIIWYRVDKTFSLYIRLKAFDGSTIDIPIDKWNQWLIKRALKKYCK